MSRSHSEPLSGFLLSRKAVALLIIGFSSGLPLFLTSKTLQAWMTLEGIDLTTIGLFSMVGIPYSFKFLLAPLMDRYTPGLLGRRRGWLLITQLLIMASIALMAIHDPRTGLWMLGANALLIAFFSAGQDIVADAYRTDVLHKREMGLGAAVFVFGYRIALLLTGSLALILADRLSWPSVYLLMAALVPLGMLGTYIGPEPEMQAAPPNSLTEAVVLPLKEFFGRTSPAGGIGVLLFIVLYRLGDSMASLMATPFLLKQGFSQTAIGTIQGGIGLGATIVGVLAGGALLARTGINKALWIFGILQAGSNLAYYVLSLKGTDYAFMTFAVVVENFCAGLGTAAFLAFLMALCNVRFSATQFALLSSITAVGRDLLASPSGKIAEMTGWPVFFLITFVAAIPGILLLSVYAPFRLDSPPASADRADDTE